MRAAAIAGNCQQPRQKLPLGIPMRKAFQSACERFLGHIFRILALAKHTVTQSENLALELIDQCQHRGLITRERPLDEVFHFGCQQQDPQIWRTVGRYKEEYPAVVIVVSTEAKNNALVDDEEVQAARLSEVPDKA